MSALSRLNSILNNPVEIKSSKENLSIESMWNNLVNGDMANKQRNKVDGNLPLSRLLGQTYSYSSDSSASPQGNSNLVPQQLSSRNSVVFSDDSPQSATSASSFRYSSTPGSSYPSRSFRASSVTDPGTPNFDDAILMGAMPDSPFGQMGSPATLLSPNPTTQEFNLSALMNSLTVGNPSTSNLFVNGQLRQQQLSPSKSASSNSFLSSINNTSCNNSYLTNGLSASNSFQSNGNGSALQSSLGLSINSPTLPSNYSQGMDINEINQLQNIFLNSSHLLPPLDSSNLYGGLGGDLRRSPTTSSFPSPLTSFFPGTDPYAIEKQARMHRSAAALCDATCTWNGPLPQRATQNPFYSCKVFLGGVPWDVTELTLRHAFMQFGNIQVEWPGKENSANPPKGYVYIIFENERQVRLLLNACSQNADSDNYFFSISSRRMRQREVQVIPWVISDSNYVRKPSYQLDPAKTVFVGALHGMLSAEALANIMNDLFGGVVYSGIDTDKYKYPIGSGRVTFNNVHSFRKAVRAAFIEIKTQKFTKKVQVDPYLADSHCQLCDSPQGPYFCRDEECFKYYCRTCWLVIHCGTTGAHKPMMRDPKFRTQSTLNRMI